MQCKTAITAAFGMFVATALLPAQAPATRPASWRGAGLPPCIGTDGGSYQCPPAPRTIAVRAGHLFESTTGRMLTKQVVVLHGERITEVGPEAVRRLRQ